jgi:hypothetical protein
LTIFIWFKGGRDDKFEKGEVHCFAPMEGVERLITILIHHQNRHFSAAVIDVLEAEEEVQGIG